MFLTDREFWIAYWESHRDEVNTVVPAQNLFSGVFQNAIGQSNIKSSCELGGFPGTFSIYLRRKYQLDTTLVDYVIHQDLLKDVLATNQLNPDDLKIIEADIFNYQPQTQYDLTFSIGLIEHFEDTKKIISLHLDYMKPGSKLVIFLPNFRGLNGWFQRNFDRENYDKHNIKSMDVNMLRSVCTELQLKDIQVSWFGKFGVWLERENQKPTWVRLLKKAVWFVGKVVSKILPIDSKQFSPYILITAKK
ncbi:MAG: class I SAM-dependent methyltransferase [Bacteroidia bacterium]|nr:class I SAM-dependent methyltransferase [Bacteroidia bacterium]